MQLLIWIGVILSLLGLCGLIYCIVTAMRAKRAGLSDEEMRDRLRGLVAWNLGALLLSSLGLIMVAVGLLLG
ncbi:hypothetical protein PARPLA_02613 [Rhodobacteraceae bacterium THAF1]|uniref:hypothetical protein n=1 Tax=Palleronia sp. THAF1 TaxID=2587842 RepID=UPI000F3D892F|nr:hypothetical protein [Palleronia sp. THAF1]QFU08092.1 hypothetical protein FIU81_05340 [Palleronia sp. THAF1]VDC27950.1 hypothetical protein PARPLA_02613 [Rhodobacteraceae bacterium THAF1]